MFKGLHPHKKTRSPGSDVKTSRFTLPSIRGIWMPAVRFRWRAELGCPVCRGFAYDPKRHFFAANELAEEWMGNPRGVIDEGSRGSRAPSLALWRGSAERGCYTCGIVMAAIKAILPQWLDAEGGKHIEAVSPPARRDVPIQVLLVDVNREDVKQRWKRLDIFQQDGQPRAYMKGMLRRGDIVQRTNVEALLWARDRLQICDERHHSCRGAAPGMPLRLIDVGDPASTELDRILKEFTTDESATPPVQGCLDALFEAKVICRLVSGHDSDVPGGRPYIALSYCWGTAREEWLMTTTGTLASFCEEIPWKTAPKTIRDAILLTRFLGVRYLWVDALCIAQNDRDEWLKESACMSDTYAGASLVVAAATTPDCTKGFFGEQLFGDELHQVSCLTPKATDNKFTRLIWWWGSRHKTLYIRKGTFWQRHAVFGNGDFMVSRRRGWAFQEQLFARRILHVSRFEMLWRCGKGTSCECSWSWSPQKKELVVAASPFQEAYGIHQVAQPVMSTEHLFVSWMALVTRYSWTQITDEDDRLVAISGLSRYFGIECLKANHTDYLAGLWRQDLARQLCWFTFLPAAMDPDPLGDYGPPPPLPPSSPPRNPGERNVAAPCSPKVETEPPGSACSSLEDRLLPLRRVNSPPPCHTHTGDDLDHTGALVDACGEAGTNTEPPGGGLWKTFRPTAYRAPSWSWASVHTPVRFCSARCLAPRSGFLDAAKEDGLQFHSRIKIHTSEAVTLAGLPFGPVSTASIVLEGAVTPIRLRVLPDSLPDSADEMTIHQPVSRLVLRTASGHIFAVHADIAMKPTAALWPETWTCLLRSLSGGTRCDVGPQCGCGEGFLDANDEFYALRVGYTRYNHGVPYASVWINEIYMIVRKVRSAEYGRTTSQATYERIGLGNHAHQESETTNFRLFEAAEVKTVRLV